MNIRALFYINILPKVEYTYTDLIYALSFYSKYSKYLGMFSYNHGEYCSIDPKIVKEYLNGKAET
jgi:hypothetical protein